MQETTVKIWAFRFVTLGLAFLLIAVFVEVGLRLVYPQFGGCDYAIRDTELGWKLSPNHAGLCISEGHRTAFRVEISQEGFRSPEFASPKPPNVRRILMLGDSMAFGSGVEMSKTAASVLEAELSRVSPEIPRYEVINAAAPGYGTGQQWLLYQRVAADLDPDAVLLMFFVSNDLLNNICYHAWETHPCFGFKDGELTLESMLTEEELTEAESDSDSRRDQLHSYIFFRDRVQSLFATNPALARFIPKRARPATLPKLLNSWYNEELYTKSWEITEALLDEIEVASRMNGDRLILVILPASPQTTENFRRLTEVLYGDTPEGAAFLDDPLRPQEVLLRWAEEREVTAVDTLAALKRAAAKSSIYLPDRHLNELGNRVVAAEIQTALLSAGVLTRSDDRK